VLSVVHLELQAADSDFRNVHLNTRFGQDLVAAGSFSYQYAARANKVPMFGTQYTLCRSAPVVGMELSVGVQDRRSE